MYRSWFQYRQRVSQLNAFLIDLMRRRWAARQAGNVRAGGDILDRILAALQLERASRRSSRHATQVERGLAQAFPWIDRPKLDGLIARCSAVERMADLSPVE